jgi:hypothetical protein
MFFLHLSPKLNNFGNSKQCAVAGALPHCYNSFPVVFVVIIFLVVVVVVLVVFVAVVDLVPFF